MRNIQNKISLSFPSFLVSCLANHKLPSCLLPWNLPEGSWRPSSFKLAPFGQEASFLLCLKRGYYAAPLGLPEDRWAHPKPKPKPRRDEAEVRRAHAVRPTDLGGDLHQRRRHEVELQAPHEGQDLDSTPGPKGDNPRMAAFFLFLWMGHGKNG